MGEARADPRELALLVRREGWQVAVHDYLRARDPASYRYATDPQVATWRLLVSLPEQPKVLLLHPGIGVAPFLLAQDGAVVSCACGQAAESDYILARASQQGLGQVRAYTWDGERSLPEDDGEFDLVAAGLHGPPLRGPRPFLRQAAVLRESRRLLRPGGELFLAGANAAHPQHFGRGLSLGGCRRAMEREGFRSLRFYGLLPSHWQPFFIIPLGTMGGLQHCLNRLARGYDFSEALRPAAWALWRTAAGPALSALGALRLTSAMRWAMPAYGAIGRQGEAT